MLSPASTALATPVPLGAIVISPFAPSVIVTVPEFVPLFVSKTKSYAPLEVRVADAAPVPILVSPVPFGIRAISTFESPPVADMLGALPVAAFVISN